MENESKLKNFITKGETSETENHLNNLSRDQIFELLKNRKLTKDLLSKEADRRRISIFKVGILILRRCGLIDEYIKQEDEINKEKTIESGEEFIVSFFEKIQQPQETIPAEIEQESEVDVTEVAPESEEPQAIDVPATPAVATAPPEEETQQAVATPQEAETPEAPEEQTIPSPEPILPEKTVAQPPENLPIEETFEAVPNPGRRRWQEVKRETEVMAIEDLDGSMNRFKEHVKKLGVAEEDADGEWHWTGGNKKLVFLGDILGDRAMDGMKITSIIGSLSEQAQKQDGQVDFLCGNHDMEFLDFLLRIKGDKYAEKNADHFTRQGIGVWELAKFDPDLKKINPSAKIALGEVVITEEFKKMKQDLWPELYAKIPEILATMKTSPEGINILKNICQMKVVVIHDDTLFCHTDPTIKMINDLLIDGDISRRVTEINYIFQENLRKAVFENKQIDADFKHIASVYLHADNREYFTEKNSIVGLVEELLHKRIANGMDRSRVEKNIEEWKREYEILGDCTDEVCEIFGIGKLRGKNQKISKTALEDRLIEKIEKINPIINKVEKVINSGINAIIHGHSPRKKNYNNFYNENNFIIASPHAHFDDSPNADKGTSVIRKNGRIELIGKSFRK